MNSVIQTRANLAKFIAAAGFFALGGMAVGGQAQAQEPAATSTATIAYPVGFSDLDVSTMKGAKTLYLRIRFAAETVCASAATWGKKEGQACVDKAVDEAVARVNRPLLSQYHQLRSKGDKAGLVQLAKAN